jgi:hypothetical protein
LGYTLYRKDRISAETNVKFCIAVRKAEIVGKMIQEQREGKRKIEGGQNS